jgi:uncharacterized YigZ family protein
MAEGYYTVKGGETAEQTLEKSRFIADIAHVTTSTEVERHMAKVRQEYPGARHYVYAYRLKAGRTEKSSDDGEPQGTGGRPVLDLLQHRQVWDVQIIVVRYFGGILLGTGGLTRAYGGTARLALAKAGIVKLVPHQAYALHVPYSWYEQVKYGLKQKDWESDNEQFTEEVSLTAYIPEGEETGFENWLDEFTGKQVTREKTRSVLKKENE